ncbi:MAG: TIGR04133 family radical SAM/SPASM protein [Alistipes sp.]
MANCRLSWRKSIGLRLFSHLYADLVAKHELRTLFWECTLRCNLSCRHCGSDCRVDPAIPDMPLSDFLRVLDQEVTPHVHPADVLIIFSGGEVLLREDLEQAGAEVTRRGYAWGMVTNGFALTQERLHSLMRAGLRSVSVSLDGFADTHLYVRRNPNSFERALQAIRMIVAEPTLTYDVITCVTSPLVARLEEFKEFLISEGVAYWRIATIFPSGRAKNDATLCVSDAQLREIMEFIKQTRAEGRIDVSFGCEGFLGNYEAEVRDDFYQCAAGISVASIRIDGAISGCTSIRADYHQGNIYQDKFWQVWQERFVPYRDRSWMHKDACATCEMFRFCQGGGMHLRDDQGELAFCTYKRLTNG